ncbi:MAG: chaperone modulator CbpM [Acetobacteraceae bacterium]|nr:chaperone modulator CbpM [Acetobacteraceae bacterium]
MITVAAVLARLPGLDEQRLRVWIAEDWVRPIQTGDGLFFAEIDVARLNLILELHELEVGAGAMPVVLSLLDRVHHQRRQMARVVDALRNAGVDPAQLMPDDAELER